MTVYFFLTVETAIHEQKPSANPFKFWVKNYSRKSFIDEVFPYAQKDSLKISATEITAKEYQAATGLN